MFRLFNRFAKGVSKRTSGRRQSPSRKRSGLGFESLENRVVFSSTVSVPTAVRFSEGASYQVPITRTGDLSKPVTLNYTFAASSASFQDFSRAKGLSGTVTLNPGIKTFTLSPVTAVDDKIDEDDERFYLRISLAAGSPATIGNNSTSLAIKDNDAPPNVSITALVSSKNEDGGNAYFRVSLDAPSEKSVTVKVQGQSHLTFDWGRDAFFADYPGNSAFYLSIPPKQMTQDIKVALRDDKIIEPDELVQVSLTSGTNISGFGAVKAMVTIKDNDIPTVIVDDAGSINEGNAAGAKANFKVRVVEQMERAVKVNYQTVDGDANSVKDYVGTSGTLSFGGSLFSNSTTSPQTVSVPLRADTIKEPTAENFFLRVGPFDTTSQSRLTLPKTSGKATILDDDAPPKTQVGTPAPISAVPTPENGLGMVLYRWAAASNARYYEIELWKENSRFRSSGRTGNVTSYSPMYTEWLTEGVYYWRVRALAADYTEGAWSDEHRFVMPKESAA